MIQRRQQLAPFLDTFEEAVHQVWTSLELVSFLQKSIASLVVLAH